MSSRTGTTRKGTSAGGQGGRSATHSAAAGAANSPWVQRAARLGLAARGLVYLLIAMLAIQISQHRSSEKADESGAFHKVAEQPFGKVVLWLVVLGFLGYALWQVIDAIVGQQQESGGKRVAVRAGLAIKAAIYLSLALAAARIATDSGESGGSADVTAKVLEKTGGRWLIGLVGLGIVALGVYFVIKAVKASFEEDLDTASLSAAARKAVLRLGRAGYLARGIVFGIIGALVVLAAVRFDPAKAQGFDLALRELASQPYGRWLLLAVALGLACFGAYSLVEAKLRRL